MKKYNFDKTIDRRKTYSYRWKVKQDELPLSIADMDFEVFPEIRKAIKKRSQLDCYGYIETPKSYFDAYIHWWKSRYNIELKEEWFSFSTSIVGSLDSILKRMLKPGEQVTMFTPIYNVFFNCIKNNNLVLKECELKLVNNKYDIDWEKFESILKEEKTKAFIFCNPHNPVGRGFNIEEVDKIINLCKKYDIYLLSDEIHCDIDYNQTKYISVFASKIKYEKTILMISPGKTFNVAGLQSSAVVIPDKKLRELIQVGLFNDDIGGSNYFAIDPIIAAYNLGEEFVSQLNDYLFENKQILIEFLHNNLPNLKIVGGDFTYLLWMDISYYYKDSVKFCEDLRKEVGLILLPGVNYGKSGEGFVRINIATPRKLILDGLDRLNEFFNSKGEN